MGAKEVAANLMRRMSNRLTPPARRPNAEGDNPRLQRLAKKVQRHQARIARLEEQVARPQRPGTRGAWPEQRPGNSAVEGTSVRKQYDHLRSDKLRLIDLAFQRFGARSFADLGGVGKVDGGYTFYTFDEYGPERGVLADVRAGYLRDKAERYPALDLVEGNFGEEAVAERVGSVDALYLFAVLVHQGHEGAADWNDILDLYADRASLFLVHNPQWTGSEESVRLSEFAREEYREKVPGTKGRSLQEMKPVPTRPDGGHLRLPWEVGITDADLMEKMKTLGFKLQYFENTGRFRKGFENFENHAFIFSK